MASYNIHRCIGSDGRYAPDRIREVLDALDADVIALQEVEVFRHDPAILDDLCSESDWQAIHGITMNRDSGDYGNAILTRLPFIDLRRQDLSIPGREPRGALHLRFEIEAAVLHVVATHLGLSAAERRVQAKALVGEIDQAVERAETLVLMGDFNEWFRWSPTRRRLDRRFMPTPAPATFPTRLPLFALDRIWITPGVRSVTVEAVRSPLTRVASDHLPLVAELRL